ncbi:MAG: HTH-type transcriptional repressor AseR [Candidatus Anoxychlamydiales bacterium]|nr:HTH-type transcriptional repressor AseR [Candidatus Anoxychlamydiales bacterium]
MITPTELFTLLSDQTRLRCILLLIKEKEICVCEFTHILNSIQPKISRHLAYLRKSGLVLDERREQWVYYKLNNNLTKWTKQILINISSELKNTEPYKSDFEKNNKLKKQHPCKI